MRDVGEREKEVKVRGAMGRRRGAGGEESDIATTLLGLGWVCVWCGVAWWAWGWEKGSG